MAAIDVFDFAPMLAVTEAVVREAIAMPRNAVAIIVAIAIDRDGDTAAVACGHLGRFAPAPLERRAYPADGGDGRATRQATWIEPIELLVTPSAEPLAQTTRSDS